MRILRMVTSASWLLGLFVFGPWGASAHAGLDIDMGATLQINDDTQVFLAVSSRYFERDREVIVLWRDRYDNPDDCTVAFFLARHSGKSPQQIFNMRREGLSWWEIGFSLGVPVDVWFVPVSRDPGPPYGNAYGHWRKHKRNPEHHMFLTDAEIRDLVSVRMVHEYYGVDASVAMEWRASGKDIQSLMAKEYRKRHGSYKQAGVNPPQGLSSEQPGKSKSPEKGKAKGKK